MAPNDQLHQNASKGVVMLHATPVVFIVDDDVSVRSALESLIERKLEDLT